MIPELELKKALTATEWRALKHAVESENTQLHVELDCMLTSGMLSGDTPDEFLTSLMEWSTTPQGHDYWSDIYRRIGEIAYKW